MSTITPEIIAKMKADPLTAALGEKLEKGEMIPKDRFDEINTKRKELQDSLDEIDRKAKEVDAERLKKAGEYEKLLQQTQAEKEAEVKKAADIQKLLDAEKKVADEARKWKEDRKKVLKETLGDLYLSEFDSPDFPIASIEKIAETVTKNGTFTKAAQSASTKLFTELTGPEQEAMIAAAIQGKLKK